MKLLQTIYFWPNLNCSYPVQNILFLYFFLRKNQIPSTQLVKYNCISLFTLLFLFPSKRWSDQIDKVLNPESLKITVLRDPIKNFESVWGFFRDYPFLQWLGENRRLNTFLENPAKYYNRSTPWYFRAQNYMAFDLGLDFEDNSPEYIQKAISLMEQRFGLVLLTDYFEESLILSKGIY